CGVAGGVGGKYHADQGKSDGKVAHLKSPRRIENIWKRKLVRKLYTKNPRSAPQKIRRLPDPRWLIHAQGYPIAGRPCVIYITFFEGAGRLPIAARAARGRAA